MTKTKLSGDLKLYCVVNGYYYSYYSNYDGFGFTVQDERHRICEKLGKEYVEMLFNAHDMILARIHMGTTYWRNTPYHASYNKGLHEAIDAKYQK